ncbi:MAG: hypothetical protein PHN88_04710 [Ignavibacteria bacterium]|nr:hypothetical protein [Ignavibacteria bacterium]
MKIEILGRFIEIDDEKVKEVFEKKYKRYEYLDMDKVEFMQRGLDYFEHSLEKNILYALDTNLGIALSAFSRIAEYNYEDTVSPFKKPGCEMKYLSPGFILKDDERFFCKYQIINLPKNNTDIVEITDNVI